jgi:hypothetical protein
MNNTQALHVIKSHMDVDDQFTLFTFNILLSTLACEESNNHNRPNFDLDYVDSCIGKMEGIAIKALAQVLHNQQVIDLRVSMSKHPVLMDDLVILGQNVRNALEQKTDEITTTNEDPIEHLQQQTNFGKQVA